MLSFLFRRDSSNLDCNSDESIYRAPFPLIQNYINFFSSYEFVGVIFLNLGTVDLTNCNILIWRAKIIRVKRHFATLMMWWKTNRKQPLCYLSYITLSYNISQMDSNPSYMTESPPVNFVLQPSLLLSVAIWATSYKQNIVSLTWYDMHLSLLYIVVISDMFIMVGVLKWNNL